MAQFCHRPSDSLASGSPATLSPSKSRRSRRFSGTPAFASPELISDPNGTWDRRGIDIWAVGITLYRMVHGTMPFRGRSIIDNYASIAQDGADPALVSVSAASPHGRLSPELKDLLMRMLDRDPVTRITAEQMMAHPWISSHRQSSSSIHPPT